VGSRLDPVSCRQGSNVVSGCCTTRLATELSFGNCCTHGIRGLLFESAFTKLSKSRTLLFFAAI
jgi:hypothetical protein